jgi:hypothetical protein
VTALERVAPVFAVVGDDPAAEAYVREQIAFYASTPAYAPVLDHHGWGALGTRLRGLLATGDTVAMRDAIADDVLDAFAVCGRTWLDAARAARSSRAGLVDRVAFYRVPGSGPEPADVPTLRAALSSSVRPPSGQRPA